MSKVCILYVSNLISKRLEENFIKKEPDKIGLQVQKYHRLLTWGFSDKKCNVAALSFNNPLVNMKSVVYDEKERKIQFHYILPHISKMLHIKVILQSFQYAFLFLKKHKNSVVICDVLCISNSIGALLAAVLLKRDRIGIVTDLPETLAPKESMICKFSYLAIHLCNKYILLTEQMSQRINSKKKYIVLEGHVDTRMEKKENCLGKKADKKICIYAGGLYRKYGVEKLVQAFKRLEIDDAELHIYGDGDYADELRKNKNKSIIYHGIVSNEEVIQAEIQATLLINPRPSNEEFTKYSFPSKNMEYMASGTPVLTTKLPGMPKEYNRYVYVFEDESIEGMIETMKKVLNKPREELHKKGMLAKKFVMKYKNNDVQAEKVIRRLIRK